MPTIVHGDKLYAQVGDFDYGGRSICQETLDVLPRIRTVQMDFTIMEAAVEEMARAICHYKNIVRFECYCRHIRMPSTALAFATLLSTSTTLRVLDINTCHMPSVQTSTVLDGLRNCARLRKLRIGGNRIDAECAQKLACALRDGHCPALRTLDVSGCGLTGDSVQALVAHGLLGIEKLDLSNNGPIDEQGAAAIGRLLEHHKTLRKFEVWQCYMEGAATQRVLRGAVQCQTLEHLNVGGNKYNTASISAAAGVIRQCSSLRLLGLSCGSLSEEQSRILLESAVAGANLHKLHLDPALVAGTLRIHLNCCHAMLATHANVRVSELFNEQTPPLGDGQDAGGAGLLAELPNELLVQVAARIWPTRSLFEASHTCRLFRSCALSNYTAVLRWGPGYGDWRQHAKHVELEAISDYGEWFDNDNSEP
jgi:hypothetical protein